MSGEKVYLLVRGGLECTHIGGEKRIKGNWENAYLLR